MEGDPPRRSQGSHGSAQQSRVAAFFDVDGTLVGGESVWKGIWSYHFAKRRRRGRMLRFLAVNLGRAALYKLGVMKRDEVVAAWGEGIAVAFAGLSPQAGRDLLGWVWEHALRPHLRPEVVAELRRHQQAGHLTVLVSATFEPLLEILASELEVSAIAGSRLETRDGVYTGRVVPPLCFGPWKAERARRLAEVSPGIDLDGSFAYADSGHDAVFLAAVGHPVAVYPDRVLHRIARERGWPVLGDPPAE